MIVLSDIFVVATARRRSHSVQYVFTARTSKSKQSAPSVLVLSVRQFDRCWAFRVAKPMQVEVVFVRSGQLGFRFAGCQFHRLRELCAVSLLLGKS